MAPEPIPVSGLTKVLLLVLGLTLMLVATGVIEVDPAQLRAAPAVLFGTGLLFLMLGVLAIAQPRRTRHPQAFQLLVALLASSAAALVGLITFYSHDERLAIGPFVFSGPAVDAFGKVVLGLDALMLAAAALWCWSVWWRRRAAA
jgi:FtsH-binding integral membrane protein